MNIPGGKWHKQKHSCGEVPGMVRGQGPESISRNTCGRAVPYGWEEGRFFNGQRKTWNNKWRIWDILLHRKWRFILWTVFYKNCSKSDMAGGSVKWYSCFGKLTFLKIKLNINPSNDPAVALIGIYPREIKTYVHTDTYLWMFTKGLFIITNLNVFQLVAG